MPQRLVTLLLGCLLLAACGKGKPEEPDPSKQPVIAPLPHVDPQPASVRVTLKVPGML